MPETDSWLADYGENHREIGFAGIYWVAVLTLVLGTVGILWSLPIPEEFVRISPLLNWGSAFLMAAVVYYFIISIPLAVGMLPFIFGIAAIQMWLVESPYSIFRISAVLLAVSLAGLWMGHRGKGGYRAVVHDIQLTMIAPVWLLSILYKRLGIPY